MDRETYQHLAKLDHAHVWHPFTPMRQWRQSDPIIIEAGEDEFLIDAAGNRYIDGVSSLWCNIHGHRVQAIDEAIRRQLDQIAHSTMLGLANVPATELAAKLCELTPGKLNKVFYSDAGATATEVAFKMAVGYWYHTGQPQRHTFIGLEGAYHGDTTGAMSIGYSDLFHRPFKPMTFETAFVPPDDLDALEAKLTELGDRCAGVVIEPLVQGAAGMIMQSPGYIGGVQSLCRKHGVLLIADEVATGFGRTGRMFACEHEDVEPDLLCLGKGLTGGYLPLAATLCTDRIAEAFEGELHEMKTLYHGHTFTGNPLGCAAALASIELFEQNDVLAGVRRKIKLLDELFEPIRQHPAVDNVRQCGLIAGIEMKTDTEHAPSGGTELGDFGESPSKYTRRIGYEVTERAQAHGVIIRPLGNVIIIMPPLSIREQNLRHMIEATHQCIEQVAGRGGSGA